MFEDMTIEELEVERQKIAILIMEKNREAEEAKPKTLKTFRHTIRASGTFTTQAYNVTEAYNDITNNYGEMELFDLVKNWEVDRDREYPYEI